MEFNIRNYIFVTFLCHAFQVAHTTGQFQCHVGRWTLIETDSILSPHTAGGVK